MGMTFRELIDYAKKEEASDVHVTVGTNIALRRFGNLEIMEPAPSAEEATELIFSELSEQQIAQVKAGEDLDFALMTKDGTRLRANIYHQRNNIAATYRILRSKIPTFQELHVPDAIRKLILEPRGLILITGPTGSGKTTTLASMIDYVNQKQAKHVMTIEDPIEYVYYHAKSMIHQREVGRDVDSFAKALRSSLREDPDIILVGEMRDYETISAALTAAETGHLVMSTLHTTGAAQTIDRIIDACPAGMQNQVRTQLASVLNGVITQCLIPNARGNGRVVATEILVGTDAVCNQIRENKCHQLGSLMQSGSSVGMHTLNGDLSRLVQNGMINRQMAYKYSNDVAELDQYL